MALISGRMLIRFMFMMSVLFNAEMAWVGVINPWIVTGYPATVKSASLLRGNAAPVKNMNKNIGKLPTTNTSLADLVTAAMIKLKEMMDKLVKPAMISISINDPW